MPAAGGQAPCGAAPMRGGGRRWRRARRKVWAAEAERALRGRGQRGRGRGAGGRGASGGSGRRGRGGRNGGSAVASRPSPPAEPPRTRSGRRGGGVSPSCERTSVPRRTPRERGIRRAGRGGEVLGLDHPGRAGRSSRGRWRKTFPNTWDLWRVAGIPLAQDHSSPSLQPSSVFLTVPHSFQST